MQADQPLNANGSGSGNRRRGFFDTRYWLRDLILSLLLAFIFVIFLYQPVQVEGTSMLPRLENRERIFINKFVYRFEPVRRGDIVVFHFPLDPSKSFIKRVIGLPGETVRIRDGSVFIDGRALNEPYVPARFEDHDDCAPVTLGGTQYFVMGDHRDSSDDSREWGPVDRKFIYGKAVFVYWPLGQVGALH